MYKRLEIIFLCSVLAGFGCVADDMVDDTNPTEGKADEACENETDPDAEFPHNLVGVWESTTEDCVLTVIDEGFIDITELTMHLTDSAGTTLVRRGVFDAPELIDGHSNGLFGNQVDARHKEGFHDYRVRMDLDDNDDPMNVEIGHRDFPSFLFDFTECPDLVRAPPSCDSESDAAADADAS